MFIRTQYQKSITGGRKIILYEGALARSLNKPLSTSVSTHGTGAKDYPLKIVLKIVHF